MGFRACAVWKVTAFSGWDTRASYPPPVLLGIALGKVTPSPRGGSLPCVFTDLNTTMGLLGLAVCPPENALGCEFIPVGGRRVIDGGIPYGPGASRIRAFHSKSRRAARPSCGPNFATHRIAWGGSRVQGHAGGKRLARQRKTNPEPRRLDGHRHRRLRATRSRDRVVERLTKYRPKSAR